MVPPRVAGEAGPSGSIFGVGYPMLTFGLGLLFMQNDDPFHRRTKFESRSTNDDWFIGFGMGASFSSFEFEYVGNFDARLYNFTPELMIGRNYSEVWTIRFELSGFLARERAHMEPEVSDDGATVTDVLHPGHWYTFNCLHTDFMINLTHLFNFRRGVKWNFLPYLGAGPVWRYQDHPRFDVAADAGFMARRYINNMGDLYIDLKYIMVPPRVAGEAGPSGSIFGVGYPMIDLKYIMVPPRVAGEAGPSGSIFGVGYPMLTFGYIHNFGHSTTRYRMPVNSSIN